MSIVLFIVILAVLILVHELGHFLAARSVGARVDEFGIGFPPRAWAFRPRGSETEYSVNWIPFGGFVKIAGENGDDETTVTDPSRSLTHKNRLAQVWVLAAGVVFNIVFAWLLLAGAFMSGVPTSVTPETRGLVGEPTVMILETFGDAPATTAGLEPGDVIHSISVDGATPTTISDVTMVQDIVRASPGVPLSVSYERDGTLGSLVVTPAIDDAREGVIGVSLDMVGTVRLGFVGALVESARTTGQLLVSIAHGLGSFVADAFRGAADYAQISGPVGIAGMVGQVSSRGFVALISFAAIISLNLAIINLVPFPALDGGRILFVIIESIIRRPLPTKFTQWANVIGFGALLILMVAITANDVIKLF